MDYKPTRINSLEELNTVLDTDAPKDFYIAMGPVRSSKSIMLTDDGNYDILNEIDDSQQILTPVEIMSEEHTMIGIAITKSAFFMY